MIDIQQKMIKKLIDEPKDTVIDPQSQINPDNLTSTTENDRSPKLSKIKSLLKQEKFKSSSFKERFLWIFSFVTYIIRYGIPALINFVQFIYIKNNYEKYSKCLKDLGLIASESINYTGICMKFWLSSSFFNFASMITMIFFGIFIQPVSTILSDIMITSDLNLDHLISYSLLIHEFGFIPYKYIERALNYQIIGIILVPLVLFLIYWYFKGKEDKFEFIWFCLMIYNQVISLSDLFENSRYIDTSKFRHLNKVQNDSINLKVNDLLDKYKVNPKNTGITYDLDLSIHSKVDLFNTKIIITDYLFNILDEDEYFAVLCRELGHINYYYRHLVIDIVKIIINLAIIFIAYIIYNTFDKSSSNLQKYFIISSYIGCINLFKQMILNYFNRSIETKCDLHVLDHKCTDAFVSALKKIGMRKNISEYAGTKYMHLLMDHHFIGERINALITSKRK